MSEYRIEKTRRRIIVTVQSGEKLAGDIFLQPVGRYGEGIERPIDIFNDSDLFFPFAIDGGETVLLAKDHVVAAHIEHSTDERHASAGISRALPVELRLITGDTFVGQLLLEVPEGNARLLDFLNRLKTRFLQLGVADGQMMLISRNMIERVRAVD